MAGNTKRRTIRLQLPSAAARLDQAICDNCAVLSRTLLRKIIDAGGVHINGRRVRKCGTKTDAGDKVEIFIDGFPFDYYRLSASDIVLQDKYIIVINKPALVESQPTPARFKGTLYEALLLWLQDPYRRQIKPSLGMVQRLDRETSGVMIFSIHTQAHKNLTQAFSQHNAQKTYLALICGHLENSSGEFVSEVAKNRATNKMKSVAKGGKLAITHYTTIRQFEHCSLVEVVIPTGRTHQIRVHFSEAGHPLLGDVRYGYQPDILDIDVPRTMLHSSQLQCQHPVTGAMLHLQAPLASDFKSILNHLGCTDVDLSAN
ncbi:MAG: RluA family pseudouridine synthase [Desulfuromonas sp.]|nr:RluA family pseudouridine synthase [Desulfuromonas sp.]